MNTDQLREACLDLIYAEGMTTTAAARSVLAEHNPDGASIENLMLEGLRHKVDRQLSATQYPVPRWPFLGMAYGTPDGDMAPLLDFDEDDLAGKRWGELFPRLLTALRMHKRATRVRDLPRHELDEFEALARRVFGVPSHYESVAGTGSTTT